MVVEFAEDDEVNSLISSSCRDFSVSSTNELKENNDFSLHQ